MEADLEGFKTYNPDADGTKGYDFDLMISLLHTMVEYAQSNMILEMSAKREYSEDAIACYKEDIKLASRLVGSAKISFKEKE